MASITRTIELQLSTNVDGLSAPLATLLGYMNLPPVVFYGTVDPQKNVVPQIGGLTLWAAQSLTLETWVQNEWGKHALYAATPNAGDALTYNALTSMWQPTPINTPIVNSLKVYGDNASIVEVKRFYSGNVLTNTSGLTTGTMTPSGAHTITGGANKSYRITIDGTGDHFAATFKWSSDGGATFTAFNVPIAVGAATGRKVLAPILLDNGVYVTFGNGQYTSGDYWSFTAIASGNQLYDLQVDTTNSITKVGVTLQIANDPNFKLQLYGVGVPALFFSATGIITFDRSADIYDFFVSGLGAIFRISSGGIQSTAVPFRLVAITTPATPPGTVAAFYQKANKPYWLDSAGVESIIPQAAKAETISGAWTFSTAIVSATITTLTSTTATITTMAGAVAFTGGPVFSAVAPRFDIQPWVNTTMLWSNSTTPATPAAGRGVLYAKNDLYNSSLYWLDNGGVESMIPQGLKAEVISGAWGFTAAGNAITVTNSVSVGGNMTALQALVTNVRFTSALDPSNNTRIGLAAASPHITLTGNVPISGYLEVGGAVAPSNTTAGDFHAKRAVLGTDAAMPASTSIYLNAAVKVNANIGFYNKAPIAQPTQGATLTNNVTSGGTANQLDNFTSLVVYATDAAAIRNDIYQMGQTLKTVVDALRSLGLLS